jgi:transposase InsO family protein
VGDVAHLEREHAFGADRAGPLLDNVPGEREFARASVELVDDASRERRAALSGRLEFYNRRRPHGSLNHKPPGARLAELNNVLGAST